ncbi:TPA: DNA-binding protein [archaeon]|uniref:DNA-binding protein n=1 Tax=Candidatus Naiadarchaeum limnaeum TaxID=2756139 RepID=A0A832UST3_9ARCH|nr:DNA-binding protein [Candidatus Naiadarchaeum limnaeum]
MKLVKQSENEYFGRYEENEDLIEALLKFCNENKIETGIFSIIGAVKSSSFAFYDQKQKKYLQMDLDENAEISHCTGNISLRENKPFIHAHILLADREGRAYGGHLVAAKVFAAEIYIKKFEKSVHRKKNESTGLHLLEP